MKTSHFILLAFFASIGINYGQVGIGTETPNAMLDITSSSQASPSNTDGMLIPKIDAFPTTDPTALQDGMLVYVTGNGVTPKGFYYWDATLLDWETLGDSAGWFETGNAGTDATINFIGTTDTQDLSFRTNNIEKMRLTQRGQLEFLNTGNSVFVGLNAGDSDNLSNNANTFVGSDAGNANISGNSNSFFGATSGANNSTGSSNGFFGVGAGFNNTTGALNNFYGRNAGFMNTTGSRNNFFGVFSGIENTTGTDNSFFGNNTGRNTTTGIRNSFFGAEAGINNVTGTRNSFFGMFSGLSNTSGSGNSFYGEASGRGNTTGVENTAIGRATLSRNQAGNNNVALGHSAGAGNIDHSKSNGIFIGYQAGINELSSHKLYIESSNSSNPLIYGEFDTDLLRINGTLQVNNPTITGYSLPAADGGATQVLQTDGNGAVSFVTPNTLDTNDWSRNGNAGTNPVTNFIGTTDAQDLSFRTNSLETLRLSQRGQLEFVNTGFSIFIGEDAGNTDDFNDNNNTFVGYLSGFDNNGSNSEFNSFYGAFSGNSFSGINNSFYGSFAGFASGGSDNSFYGFETGRNVTGFSNSFFGSQSGQDIAGDRNSFFGSLAGNTVGGDNNTFLGHRAGNTVQGNFNTILGSQAGETITTNSNANVFIGGNTADNFVGGSENVAIGNASFRFGEGNENVVIGMEALNTSGSTNSNVVIGHQAVSNVNGAFGSVVIGNRAGQSLTNISERLIIHNDDTATPLIYGEFNNQVLGFNGHVAINHQAPQAALHIEEFGNANDQTIVAVLESDASNRPVLLFSESPNIDFTAGMSLEYNGGDVNALNKMVFNGIGGNPLFEFYNGGDFTTLDGNLNVEAGNVNIETGDLIIGTTAGDREIRMGDAAGNNDRVMLRQSGTDHIFIGDIDNNGGNFTIRTGGANAVTVLSGSRNVGIGTTNPTSQLQLSTNSAAKPLSPTWTVTSDRRLKKDVIPFNDGLGVLEEINPVWFTYNGLAEMPMETGVGTIAQELQEVAPYLVKDWEHIDEAGAKETYLSVDYGPLTFIMVNAIKEQAQEITQLKSQLFLQQEQLTQMEARLSRLEN